MTNIQRFAHYLCGGFVGIFILDAMCASVLDFSRTELILGSCYGVLLTFISACVLMSLEWIVRRI